MMPINEIKKPVEVCLEIQRETDGAYFVSDGISESQFIPKSQIAIEDNADDSQGVGDTVVFIMPEWLAKDKEFI